MRQDNDRDFRRGLNFKPANAGLGLNILNSDANFIRYALDSLVEHSITGALAARHLEALFRRYGAPRVLRRYHGPEFESKVFKKMLLAYRVKDEAVPKAQPDDNRHLESFNGSLRDERLDAELFYALGEARTKMENCLQWYNGERPHQSLGYRTDPAGSLGDDRPSGGCWET